MTIITKKYKTSNGVLEIPKEDFQIIDAILVPAGSRGRYLLEIGNSIVDQVEPQMCQRNGQEDWQWQLWFFGKRDMNLLCYMYPLQQTKVVYSGSDKEDQWPYDRVTTEYTVQGRNYPTIEELIVMENLIYDSMDEFFRQVNEKPVVCDVHKHLKRLVKVPVVAFRKLNFLYYKDGCCCLRYNIE